MNTAVVSEQRSDTGVLGPAQHVDITFTVDVPGPVNAVATIVVRGGLVPGFGIRRRLEIFAPGTTQPAAVQESSGLAFATVLSHTATAAEIARKGTWLVRITNLDQRTATFRLHASFPGVVTTTTTTLPTAFIDTVVNNLLLDTKLHITRGENASFVSFPVILNVPQKKFTVPDFERNVNLLLMKLKVIEFPNDINSSSMTFSLTDGTPGFLNLDISFEESGREILGTFQAELSNVKVTVRLELDIDDNRLTYNYVRAACTLDLNVIGLPDGVLNAILHYKEKIERAVGDAVQAAFDSDDVRYAFTDAVARVLKAVLGAKDAVASVRVEGGELIVESFAAARKAVA